MASGTGVDVPEAQRVPVGGQRPRVERVHALQAEEVQRGVVHGLQVRQPGQQPVKKGGVGRNLSLS